MDFGSAVRSSRKAKGLSQAELAAAAGISRQAVVLLEQNGGRVATLNAVRAILDIRIANVAAAETLGGQITLARQRRGWTQAELAERASVAVATLRAIESDAGSVATLARVLRALAPQARANARSASYYSRKNDSRFTPPHIVGFVEKSFGSIDLDPCWHEKSYVRASQVMTEVEDGLTSRWSGRLAFVNPPFSNLSAWISRCADAYERGEVETVVALLMARTETAAFRNRLFGRADLLFLRGRISFHDESGARMGPAPFPVMFAVWGAAPQSVARFAELTGSSVVWAARSTEERDAIQAA